MLNYNQTVSETVDTPETAINILKTSSLVGITEKQIWDAKKDELIKMLKKNGACSMLQNLFKSNWEVAQEMLINTVIQN